MIGWLVGCLVGWFIGWLVRWLFLWLVCWLVVPLVGWLFLWLVGSSVQFSFLRFPGVVRISDSALTRSCSTEAVVYPALLKKKETWFAEHVKDKTRQESVAKNPLLSIFLPCAWVPRILSAAQKFDKCPWASFLFYLKINVSCW